MHAFRTEHGFTLAELILVLLILAALAAVAVPRLDGGLSLAGAAQRDGLVSALRQAHATAMGARRLVCVTVLNAQTTAVVMASSIVNDCNAMGAGAQGSVTLLFLADGTVAQSGAPAPADAIALHIAGQPDVTVYAGSGHVE